MTVKSYFLSFYLLNYFRNICYSEIANKDPMEKQKGRRTRAASDFNTYDSYSYISSGNYCRRQEKFDYVLKNSRLLADDFEKRHMLNQLFVREWKFMREKKFPIQLTGYEDMKAYLQCLCLFGGDSYVEGPDFLVPAGDILTLFENCPCENLWLVFREQSVSPEECLHVKKCLIECGLLTIREELDRIP